MGRKPIPQETIVCIERILLDESEAGRGEYLTIAKIRELLIEHFEIEVSKDTVAYCLDALASEKLKMPRNAPGDANSPLTSPYELISLAGEKPNSPKKFAVKRSYSTSQIKHLIRHLRHDYIGVETLEAERLLLKLLNRSMREEFDDDLYNSDTFIGDFVSRDAGGPAAGANGLRQLLAKVELLDTAIRERVKVRFRVVAGNAVKQKKPRLKTWTPYLVAPSDGYYYLFVRPQGNHSEYDVIPYRVDMLFDLELTDSPIDDPAEYEREQETAKRIFRAGVGRWFARSTADIETVMVAFSKTACENEKKQRYLFEALGDKKGFEPVKQPNDSRSYFRFEASRQAMEMWGFKMADLFEVIEPKPLREAIVARLKDAAAGSSYGNLAGTEDDND